MKKNLNKILSFLSIILLIICILPLKASFTYYTDKPDSKKHEIIPFMGTFTFDSFPKPIYPNEYDDDKTSEMNLLIFNLIIGSEIYKKYNEYYIDTNVNKYNKGMANEKSDLSNALADLDKEFPYLISFDHIEIGASYFQYKQLSKHILGKEYTKNFRFAIQKESPFYYKECVYSIYTCVEDFNKYDYHQNKRVFPVFKTRIKSENNPFTLKVLENVKGSCKLENMKYINEKGKLGNKVLFLDIDSFKKQNK